MDIWISWCKRKAACRYCGQPIVASTPIVKGKLWKKHTSGKKWCYRFYWHPQCWLAEAMLYLEQHPYKAIKSGRPKLILSSEDAKKRLRILRKRARLIFELKERIENGITDLNGILRQLAELPAQIEKVGGMPKSWIKSE